MVDRNLESMIRVGAKNEGAGALARDDVTPNRFAQRARVKSARAKERTNLDTFPSIEIRFSERKASLRFSTEWKEQGFGSLRSLVLRVLL